MANDRSDSRRKQDAVGADGWPSWMGDADPSLAPKPPPKTRVAKPLPAVARQKAPAPQPVAATAPPPSAPGKPRRGWRIFVCAFAAVLALVAGELAARFRPDAAIRFQQALADAVPPWTVASFITLVLAAVMVWQAGRPRRPLFLPLALVLCLLSAGFGIYRGGHDLDLERSAAQLKGRAGTLEAQLRQLQRSLAAALADKEKATGSLQKSSMAIQERDEAISALRREIDELRKKLSEKP